MNKPGGLNTVVVVVRLEMDAQDVTAIDGTPGRTFNERRVSVAEFARQAFQEALRPLREAQDERTAEIIATIQRQHPEAL